MKHQLGIDISKLTFDACLCVNGKPKRRQFSNNQAGFEELLKWFGKYPSGSVHVCMEGTGRLWEPLAEFLYAREIPVSVVNPLRIKGFAKCELRRSKTDKLDAETIARFCGMHNPRLWVAPSARLKSIRDIQRAVGALTSMQADEKNRLTSGELDPLVKATFEDHIAYLDSKIKMLEDEILILVKADEELFRKLELLMTIKGVGQKTAVTFLTEIPMLEQFSSAKEVEVFTGIAPRQFQSGSSVRGKTRMSKVGNRRIRAALYMPALAAMRSNPPLIVFAQRLRDAGKPGMVIACAVMRKLLRQMFAVVKSGCPFDPAYTSKAPKAA